MKRVRFVDTAGNTRTGEWADNSIQFGGREYDPTEVDVLPPSRPSKLVCVGYNYRDDTEANIEGDPDRPMLFLKPPNTVSGHRDIITLPDSSLFEYEAELGVVIGRQCKRVSLEDVPDIIAGYTCINDISNRTDQRREQNFVRGKAFDNAAPVGPVLADPHEVPADAAIELRINGERQQNSDRSQLIFTVNELVAEITRYMTLEPGDIVSTGTTSGAGELHDGDTVEVEVEGVGILTNVIRIPPDSTW